MNKFIIAVAILIATSTLPASAQSQTQQVCDTFSKAALIAYSKREEGLSFEQIRAFLPNSNATQRKVFGEAARIGFRADSASQAEKQAIKACREILSQ